MRVVKWGWGFVLLWLGFGLSGGHRAEGESSGVQGLRFCQTDGTERTEVTGSESILVTIVFFGNEEGLKVILQQLHTSQLNWKAEIQATSLPFGEQASILVSELPQDLQPRLRVLVPSGLGAESQKCTGWQGYRVVMEDGIIYPDAYLEFIIQQVDAFSREAIVGLQGMTWISIFIKSGVAYNKAVLPAPGNAIEYGSQVDLLVDVLRLGTVAMHSSVASETQDLDPYNFCFFQSVHEDIRFAVSAHHLGIQRIIPVGPEGFLSEDRDTPSESLPEKAVLRRSFPLIPEGAKTEKEAMKLALQFAPWGMPSGLTIGETHTIRFESEQEDGNMRANIKITPVPQREARGSECRHGVEQDGVCEQAKEPSQDFMRIQRSASEAGELTLLIPVFWRPRFEFLKETLKELVHMKVVDQILLVWNNPSWKPPPCVLCDIRDTKIILAVPPSFRGNVPSSLNNRFIPWDLIDTEPVLSMDDDFRPTETQLVSLLETWKQFPDRIVGPMWLVTRSVACRDRSQAPPGCQPLVYVTGGWPGYYNLILTGFAVFHRGWLGAYSNSESQAAGARKLVDEAFSCEDIALNFLVAAQEDSGASLAVNVGDIYEMESGEGLSTIGNHWHARSKCASDFALLYGGFHLANGEAGPHRTEHQGFNSSEDARAERSEWSEEQELKLNRIQHWLRDQWDSADKIPLKAQTGLTGDDKGENRLVVVVTVAYADLDMLPLQTESLDTFLEQDYEMVVAIDSPTDNLRQRFQAKCKSLGIHCYGTPYSDSEWESDIHSRPSHSHMRALEWLLRSKVYDQFPDSVVLVLDPDVFLINKFSVAEFSCIGGAACSMTSQHKEDTVHCQFAGIRQTSAGLVHSKPSGYLHVATLLLDLGSVMDPQSIRLAPVNLDGALHDSGGALMHYWERYGAVEFPQTYGFWWSLGSWSPEATAPTVCFLEHRYLSEDTCFSEEGNCGVDGKYGGDSFCELGVPDLIGDSCFIHSRRSSNWDILRSLDFQSDTQWTPHSYKLNHAKYKRFQCLSGFLMRLFRPSDLNSVSNHASAANGGIAFGNNGALLGDLYRVLDGVRETQNDGPYLVPEGNSMFRPGKDSITILFGSGYKGVCVGSVSIFGHFSHNVRLQVKFANLNMSEEQISHDGQGQHSPEVRVRRREDGPLEVSSLDFQPMQDFAVVSGGSTESGILLVSPGDVEVRVDFKTLWAAGMEIGLVLTESDDPHHIYGIIGEVVANRCDAG